MRLALVALVACGAPAAKPSTIANTAPATTEPAPAKLAVTGIEPDRGDAEGGTYVRITGRGFTESPHNAKVYFGSLQGTVIRFASDTELIVQAPGGRAGDVVDLLVLFEPGGELKLPKAFTFVAKQ